MGNFANNALTDNGRLLLADVQAGAVFIPTKIVVGQGNMPAGKTPATMTAVVDPVKELPINKIERTPDGKTIFGGVYTNEDITAPFYFRELAMFGRAEYRAADGTVTKAVPEVLYSYGNAGTTADLMPAYSTSTVVEKQMDLVVWVGNNTEIDLTIASGIFVTEERLLYYLGDYATKVWVLEQLENIDCGYFVDPETMALDAHNANPEAHNLLTVDGNQDAAEPKDYTLEEHVVDTSAHPNMSVDGNDN